MGSASINRAHPHNSGPRRLHPPSTSPSPSAPAIPQARFGDFLPTKQLTAPPSLPSPALASELGDLLKSLKAATHSVKLPLRISLLALLMLGFAEDPTFQVWFIDEFPFIGFSTAQLMQFSWVFELWAQIVLLVPRCADNSPLVRLVFKEARAVKQTMQSQAALASLQRVGRILSDSPTDDKATVREIHWAGAFALVWV